MPESFGLEDELLQPETEIKPHASNSRARQERFRRWLKRHMRLGERARAKTPTNAITGREVFFSRNIAVGAAVVTVRVLVAGAPLVGVTDDGANVQVTSLGRVPHENLTVPPYPPTGLTVKVVLPVCIRRVGRCEAPQGAESFSKRA